MFVKAVLYKRFKGPAYPFSQTADLVLGRYYEFQSEHVFVLFWWFFYFNLCVCVFMCVSTGVYMSWCMEVKGLLWMLVLAIHITWDRISCSCCTFQAKCPNTLLERLPLYFITGTLGLYTCYCFQPHVDSGDANSCLSVKQFTHWDITPALIFFFEIGFFYVYMYLPACMSVYHAYAWCSQRPEEHIRYTGLWTAMWLGGNRIWVLWNSSQSSNHWAIFATP